MFSASPIQQEQHAKLRNSSTESHLYAYELLSL